MPQTATAYDKIINSRNSFPAVACAIVYPCSAPALQGALEAASAGSLRPIFVGPESKIRQIAQDKGLDLSGHEIVNTPDHEAAAASRANALVHEGAAHLVMKGSLHSDELLRAVVSKTDGLLTPGRRISHVFILSGLKGRGPLFITDAAVNILPDIGTKAAITQNAVNLFSGLGLGTPNVAVMSAAETINLKMPSTIEAAALCKMAERGQITGCNIDGPLAMDNAICAEAAQIKGISGPVAGKADILVVPNIEAGNMTVKALSFLAGATAAGIVLGARIPVILTSRADSIEARLASCQIAAHYAHHLMQR